MQRQPKSPLYFETGPDNEPTMTVSPGEVFEVETQMNRGPDPSEAPDELREEFLELRNPSSRGGNPSSGAIWIEGAKPGDMLVVHIENIEPHGIGYTQYRGSTGAMPGWLGPSNVGPTAKVVRIRDGEIIWNDRFSIPIAPMLGCVGVAPFRERHHNGWAGVWGGNFDIQEVTTGASVLIPIQVEGALLHIGDMHARQGDGEICGGGGIETGGIATLRVELRDLPERMTWPRIENAEYIMTTAQAKPAEEAFRTALAEMIIWLEDEYRFERKEAYMFLAQVLEARVTQFVNPTYSYVAKVQKKYLEWTGS
ncbi:MAG: acetamidase/formamidase family protein [Chloroflexi bacterium]|nr:acetamidase/formamidase family protein [Chloroflexota bacterium]